MIDTTAATVTNVTSATADGSPDHASYHRIFDSFFTTKPDGLGMGLPICQSIIQGHGGNLAVASNNGAGTIVHFTLPLVPQEEALTR